MNRYEILLGKEPPKENLIQAVQPGESSARRVMGVDTGSGDSTSVITTVTQTDSSNIVDFTVTRREGARVEFAPPAMVTLNVLGNLHVGDMVGTDGSGVLQRITLDHLGVIPVGVAMEVRQEISPLVSVPVAARTVVRCLTVGEQANYERRAEAHRALIDAANSRALQPLSGAAIAQHYEEQREIVDLPQREEMLRLAQQITETDRNTLPLLEEAARRLPDPYRGYSPSSGLSGVSGNQTPSHRGFIHEHPRMQRDLKVPDDHVIVDRNEFVRARRRSGNR